MQDNKLEGMWKAVLRDQERDQFIDTCTIDELIEYAKEYNLHFEIGPGTAPKYIDRVTRMKARLVDAGIDPDTVRNEYWDNMTGN